MTITVELPKESVGRHRIKFNGTEFSGNYFVHRYTYGTFKLTVYYDTNRYVEFDFIEDTVKFDYHLGCSYKIDHYSKFDRSTTYIFQCSIIDLFTYIPEKDEEDI